jgi:hypothetical protein
LGALCFEVFCQQTQSSLLNSLFVLKLKEGIPVDDERARYTGNVSHQCSVWFLWFYWQPISLLSIATCFVFAVLRLYQLFQRSAPICRPSLPSETTQQSTSLAYHAIYNDCLRRSHKLAARQQSSCRVGVLPPHEGYGILNKRSNH